MNRIIAYWTKFFPLWVVLFCVAAFFRPAWFIALKPGIVPGLGLIMFAMGTTLVPADFKRVFSQKRAVATGIAGQFVIMPCLAVLISKLFGLDRELGMGLVILGCCPGGTASNVMSYLAKADVALSVSMTAASTLLAVFLTPLLTSLAGGHYLPVDAAGMLMSILKIVLIPVGAGIFARTMLKKRIEPLLGVFPAISILVIVLIIAVVTALTKDRLLCVLGPLGLAVLAHNTLGMLCGYTLGRLTGLSTNSARTIAFEVGMQNSALGVTLAGLHFSSAPMVALPSSIFSVVHNLTGSMFAGWWAKHPAPESRKKP